jgi:hypothetical protein
MAVDDLLSSGAFGTVPAQDDPFVAPMTQPLPQPGEMPHAIMPEQERELGGGGGAETFPLLGGGSPGRGVTPELHEPEAVLKQSRTGGDRPQAGGVLPQAQAAEAAAPVEAQGAPGLGLEPVSHDPFITAYHGSPQVDLQSISASPPTRQFDNATSALGAFFSPEVAGATRYAGEAGRVYKTNLNLQNPYEMPISQFLRLQDPTKGAMGEALAGPQWEARLAELKNEGTQLRRQLQASGHDGVIVRDTKGNIKEIASFNDVPLGSTVPANGDPYGGAS